MEVDMNMNRFCQVIHIKHYDYEGSSIEIFYKKGNKEEVRSNLSEWLDFMDPQDKGVGVDIWINPVNDEHILSVIEKHEMELSEVQHKLKKLTKRQKKKDVYGFSDEEFFICNVTTLNNEITKLKEMINEDCSNS
jgi:hypothetical protein